MATLEDRVDRLEEGHWSFQQSMLRQYDLLALVITTVDRLEARMDSLENRMDNLENRMDRLEQAVLGLASDVALIKAHLMGESEED